VWRVPVVSNSGQARLKVPGGGDVLVPVHEGRAVYLGEKAGFYELSGTEGSDPMAGAVAGPGAGPVVTTGAFAANLLDAEESAIEPVKELVIDGKKAGTLGGFQIGVRRELWIYLLLAALLLTFIEWITYHRRITV
jgi:Ca-activated chloride channel family protein